MLAINVTCQQGGSAEAILVPAPLNKPGGPQLGLSQIKPRGLTKFFYLSLYWRAFSFFLSFFCDVCKPDKWHHCASARHEKTQNCVGTRVFDPCVFLNTHTPAHMRTCSLKISTYFISSANFTLVTLDSSILEAANARVWRFNAGAPQTDFCTFLFTARC